MIRTKKALGEWLFRKITTFETRRKVTRQMKVLDYVLYITHHFLFIVNKRTSEDIEGRSKNALSIMVFLLSLSVSSIAFGICISHKWIVYDKTAIVAIGITLFIVVHFLILQRYKNRYNEVIETLTKIFSYSKRRIVLTFLFFWIVPIFLLWIVGIFL